jgi:hypothetical protein
MDPDGPRDPPKRDRSYKYADDSRMGERSRLAQELYTVLLGNPDFMPPFWVSDEETAIGIWFGEPEALVELCHRHYGIRLSENDLHLPLWQVLDLLDQARKQRFAERLDST